MTSKYDAVAKVAWECSSLLGEGPIWDERTDTLYWVDIRSKDLHAYTPANQFNRRIPLSVEVGAVAPRASGGLIAATKNGFAIIDPHNGALTYLADPESDLPENRFNDGAVDMSGNFIAGTMHDLEKHATGKVYCLDGDRQVTPLFGNYVVCNGPAFSPDGSILYFSNSQEREILTFSYDANLHVVGKPKPFAKIEDTYGYPDGLTVDEEGCVWCAHWDGGRVTRYSPQGNILQTIVLPVPLVTNCAFGGPEYNELYITSASWGLNETKLKEHPLSGTLFVAKVGVRGLPLRQFVG